jgi:hypothetical protein
MLLVLVKLDSSKIEAIVHMPHPSDDAALVRLLGMGTYFDNFCNNLAGLTRPLNNLLTELWWYFFRLYVFLSLSTVLSGDASPTGLGSLLLQNGQPVTFSSTSFTQTQQRYCKIELLAVQLKLLRFKQYIFGQQVAVVYDHKPLVGLLDKPVGECPSLPEIRLQL